MTDMMINKLHKGVFDAGAGLQIWFRSFPFCFPRFAFCNNAHVYPGFERRLSLQFRFTF
jgi:hypothetical protein